jgi:putative spermidine/putrescine transport system permease protein
MTLSRGARAVLLMLLVLGLLFLYLPLAIVVINSFNASQSFAFPPTGLTLKWWGTAATDSDALAAFFRSVALAAVATGISLFLGTMLAFAIQRYRWFGRESVSFLVVLPIALPGIVTGIAIAASVRTVLDPYLGIPFGWLTLILGHVTFTIVVIYNNALARLRRMAGSVEEASMDLGADSFQTFRYVTFPAVRGALVAGAVLAFGLSFDEIIVTRFVAGPGIETLPLWIFNSLFRPTQGPVVNVVATVVILLSIIPIWASQKLSQEEDAGRAGGLM